MFESLPDDVLGLPGPLTARLLEFRFGVFSYLLLIAIAILLELHPEHAMGPITRHGKAILSFCRRCYKMASGVHKDALNNYLLAHM